MSRLTNEGLVPPPCAGCGHHVSTHRYRLHPDGMPRPPQDCRVLDCGCKHYQHPQHPQHPHQHPKEHQ